MPINWDGFGDVKTDTGYPEFVLDHFWNKYGNQIRSAQDLYRLNKLNLF